MFKNFILGSPEVTGGCFFLNIYSPEIQAHQWLLYPATLTSSLTSITWDLTLLL